MSEVAYSELTKEDSKLETEMFVGRIFFSDKRKKMIMNKIFTKQNKLLNLILDLLMILDKTQTPREYFFTYQRIDVS